MKSYCFSSLQASLVAAFALAAAPVAHAVVITEDFSGYTAPTTLGGLTTVAGAGTSGGGWLNGWRSSTSGNVALTAQVLNASPIGSGGNYFSSTLTANAATGSTQVMAIGRAYDVTGNSLADVTALHINFDFRVDSIPGTMRYDLFENQVRATGATSTSYNFRTVGGFWNTISGTGATLTATTLAFTAGTTYSFAIVLNPTNSTWSYTISDGTNSVSGSSLGFRTTGFAVDAAAGSVGGRWFEVIGTETTDVSSQATTFSLDNLSISTIPEPSSAAALAGSALLGFAALRRRRR